MFHKANLGRISAIGARSNFRRQRGGLSQGKVAQSRHGSDLLKEHFLLYLTIVLLCSVGGSAQTRRKRPSVPPAQRPKAKLSQDLIRQFVSDNKEVSRYVNEGNDPMENFEAQLIDLNGDGKAEYEIVESHPENSPFCGASGLCTFWLYRNVGPIWELLLSDGAGISPLKTLTNGYRDISVDSWGGALDKYTTIYKFDGRRYQAKECLEYKAVEVRNGPFPWKLVRRGPCRK